MTSRCLTRRWQMTLLASTTLALAAMAVARPGGAKAEPANAPAAQEALKIITRAEWGSKPQPIDDARKQVPTFFTIHHEGVLWKAGSDPAQKLRNVQSWGQREKGWPDLPYHYIISPDGQVFEGRDWNYQPESNTQYDLNGVLNIELLGNFEEQRVSIEQLRALVQLVAKLSVELNVKTETLRGHNDAAPGQTTCPGKDFHRYLANGSIRKWSDELIAGKTPDIRELDALADGPTTRISTEPPAKK